MQFCGNVQQIGLQFVTFGSAIWLLSTTASRARIFKPLREYVKQKSDYIGEGISCQYCLSHWIGAALVLFYKPFFISCGNHAADLFIIWAALVGFANILGRTVGRADDKTKSEVPK